MAKIKITDLPRDEKISQAEMRRILGSSGFTVLLGQQQPRAGSVKAFRLPIGPSHGGMWDPRAGGPQCEEEPLF